MSSHRPRLPKYGTGPVTFELEKLGLRDRAVSRVKKIGLPMPKEVDVDKLHEIPYDVTDLTDVQLGEYLGLYEQAAAWCYYQMKLKEIDVQVADEICDYLYDKEVSKFKPGSGSGRTTEAKSRANSSDLYQSALNEKMQIRADYKVAEACWEAQQRYAATMSREISRREAVNIQFGFKARKTTV